MKSFGLQRITLVRGECVWIVRQSLEKIRDDKRRNISDTTSQPGDDGLERKVSDVAISKHGTCVERVRIRIVDGEMESLWDLDTVQSLRTKWGNKLILNGRFEPSAP